MRILKTWLRNTFNKEEIIAGCISVYLVAVIWITLLSRIGTGDRGILLPFQSYTGISQKGWKVLIENIENVILFMPFGLGLGALRKNDLKIAMISGLFFSLCIEILQYLFFLGIFEFDDLIHNTLGTVIGFIFAQKIRIKIEFNKHQMRVVSVVLLLLIGIPLGHQGVHYFHMSTLAALHDRMDGSKNLLVLNGKNGYAWDTEVYVTTLSNGGIRIKGKSDKKSWWPIGNLKVDPGKYSFSGLSDVEKETVGLVLETDNYRIIEDVGPVDNVVFFVEKTTMIKAYVIVYADCYCDVIATPVIFKEE